MFLRLFVLETAIPGNRDRKHLVPQFGIRRRYMSDDGNGLRLHYNESALEEDAMRLSGSC